MTLDRAAISCTDALAGLGGLPPAKVQLIITSPPYNLGSSPSALDHPNARRGSGLDWRGYGADADAQPEPEYQAGQRAMLAACARVLAPGGSVFYVHCDRLWDGQCRSPWAWLTDLEGLVVRQQIVWAQGRTHQHNPAYFAPLHEYVFWLTAPGYRGTLPADLAALGSVWAMPPARSTWHPAPFPYALAERCILACTAPGDLVADPHCGTGTVGAAALDNARRFVGFDTNPTYCTGARRRLRAWRVPLWPTPACTYERTSL